LRSADDVKSDVAGSVYMTLLDAAAGFNQVANTERARQVLAVVARSGVYLPRCLTFGPMNGPEDFGYVVDRLFSGKRTNKRRFCSTRHAYVDDLPVRTGRVLDGALFTDAEHNARVKAAAGKEPKWKLQSTPEALAEQGFIPAGLGNDLTERSRRKPGRYFDQVCHGCGAACFGFRRRFGS